MNQQDTSAPGRPATPGAPPDEPPVLSTKEARQGTTRFPVRYVLIASVILVVVALALAFVVA